MPKSKRRAARVALVTGGASGIGLAVVEQLIGDGWKVAAVDINAAAVAELQKAHSDSADVMVGVLDVTDEAAVEKLVDEVTKKLGPIDGVVNSAGIARDIPALDTPVDVFRRILDVNVIGSFIVARAVARRMKERHGKSGVGGAIVNLASVSGLRGSKGRVAYGSSKGAVIVMTQVLATDLAKYGIRVNAIAPGPVDTPMAKAVHTQDDRKQWLRHVPMKRYSEPHEIATAVVFLLDTERASYITGEVLAVDGGFRGAGLLAES